MTFLNCHMITGLKCHVNFCARPPHLESATCEILGAMGLMNMEI